MQGGRCPRRTTPATRTDKRQQAEPASQRVASCPRRDRAFVAPLTGRSMQAPTPDSDNNPHHVFRQRTKPNKPLTRRRRETQEESLEKLRAVRHNVVSALRLAEAVRDREAKKTRVNVCPTPPRPPLRHEPATFRSGMHLKQR